MWNSQATHCYGCRHSADSQSRQDYQWVLSLHPLYLEVLLSDELMFVLMQP
jgi:hypothetical protein